MGMFGAIGGMFGGGQKSQPFQKKNPMGPSMNSPYSQMQPPPPGQRGMGAQAGAMGKSLPQYPTQIPYGQNQPQQNQPQQQQKEWTNPGIAHPGAQVWNNSGYQQPPQMPPQKPYQSTFNRPTPQIQPGQGYQTTNPYAGGGGGGGAMTQGGGMNDPRWTNGTWGGPNPGIGPSNPPMMQGIMNPDDPRLKGPLMNMDGTPYQISDEDRRKRDAEMAQMQNYKMPGQVYY